MIYQIIYDAVRKKATTSPPTYLIANVEMAAGIGIIMEEIGKEFDNSQIIKPETIKERFLEYIEDIPMNSLSAQSKTILELIQEYQVKEMVNEKLRNLLDLCQMKMEDEED